MSQRSQSMIRWSQILLVIPVMIREWINMLTDIGRYHLNVHLSHTIITFPTKQAVDTLVNRDINSVILAKFIPICWIIFHGLSATLMCVGICLLIIAIKENTENFQMKKHWAILGLAISIFSYTFYAGAASMDYFLCWLQDSAINLNGDIVGYGLPLGIALLFLCHRV